MNVLIPLIRKLAGRNFYGEFANGLNEALQELGHSTQWFMLDEVAQLSAAESEAAVKWARSSNGGMVLDVCCWGFALSKARLMGDRDPEPVYDIAGVRCVGLLYDQPYFQHLAGIRSKNLYAGLPDRNHAGLIGRLNSGLKLSGSVFVPPAVRPQASRPRPWRERDIDILYVGNIDTGALGRLWRELPNAAYFDAVADQALAEPARPMHDIALEAVSGWGLDIGEKDIASLMGGVEYFLRARLRHEAVLAAAASGLPMLVVGHGWENMALPANVKLQSQVTYDEVFDLAGRARLCLDASTYIGGANDRVFHYTANGAVCITNAWGWLRGEFGENNGLHYYRIDDPTGLVDALRNLLANPGPLQEQAERGREIALGRHTWRNRVEEIIRTVK